jgi:hypothetical protein
MAEFKRLSEVEQIESTSENATVLVEDGGEIKRVPKTAVGGGAGGYVIKLANSYVDDNGTFCFNESYDELYDVLMAGGTVWVDCTDAPGQQNPKSLVAETSGIYAATTYGPHHFLVVNWWLTDVGLMLFDIFSFVNVAEPTIFYPNGSHNLQSEEK